MRKGMWAVYKGERIGIITGFVDLFAKVDFVNDKGETTVANVMVERSDLRQAKFDEIPDARRPAEDQREKFAALGY